MRTNLQVSYAFFTKTLRHLVSLLLLNFQKKKHRALLFGILFAQFFKDFYIWILKHGLRIVWLPIKCKWGTFNHFLSKDNITMWLTAKTVIQSLESYRSQFYCFSRNVSWKNLIFLFMTNWADSGRKKVGKIGSNPFQVESIKLS